MTSFPSASKPKPAGFALVLALTLMSFVFLLTISLALFIQIETSAASQQKQQEQARQNALYGLSIAMGEIQRLAGPDQRITAHATILNDPDIKNPYWVGVWDTTEALDNSNAATREASVLSWLVSGNQGRGPSDGNFLSALNDDIEDEDNTVTLVGEQSVADPLHHVHVRKLPVKSSSSAEGTGHFAYWVGDEGTKAKFNPPGSADDLLDDEESEEAVDPVHYKTLFSYPTKVAPETLTNWAGLLTNPYELEGTVSRDQLDLLNGNSDLFRRTHFHTLTPYSTGVLTNVRDGGLKQDLSIFLENGSQPALDDHPGLGVGEPLGHSDSTFGLLHSWFLLGMDAEGFSPELSVRGQTDEEVGIYPVLARVQVHTTFSVYSDVGGYALRMHLHPIVSLWNPHNIELGTEDLEISLRHFPDFEILIKEAGQPDQVLNVSLKSLHSEEFLRFAIAPVVYAPGEVLVFYPENSIPYDLGINPSTPYDELPLLITENGTPDDNFHVNTGIPVPLVAAPADATIAPKRLLPGAEEDRTLDVVLVFHGEDGIEILQEIREYLPWPAHDDFVAERPLLADEDIPALGTHPDKYALPHTGIAFTRHYIDNVPADHSLRYMTGHLRARETRPTEVELANTGAASHPDWGLLPELLEDGALDPGSFDIQIAPPPPENDKTRTYAGFSHRDEDQGSFYTLFEYPRENQPILSLGMLQHVPLGTRSHHAGYAIGNSLADPRIPRNKTDDGIADDARVDLSYLANEALWDRFFLSGINGAAVAIPDPTRPSPNRRIQGPPSFYNNPEPADLIPDFHQGARYLWVDGAFNVNSTEVESWLALLSAFRGLLMETADEVEADPDSDLKNPFPRLLYARSQAVEQDSISGSNDPSVHNAFRSLTDEQLHELAEKIVDQVLLRGPFLSLSDFVNRSLTNDDNGLKGVLQAAIDETDINADLNDYLSPAVTWSSYQSEHAEGSRATHLPGYLSQADLLSSIGSVLSARSDTFIVRSYGDVVNPLNESEIIATAICEVVVQRIPEPAVAGDDALLPENPMGRGFRITSFRWLEPGEI